MRYVILAAAATVLCTGLARAAETPVSTAAPMSTAEQIDKYLESSPVELPADPTPGVTPAREERKVHGVAAVAVGTGGYRSVYLRSDMPVGKTGVLSVAIAEARFGGRGGGRRQAQSLALNLDLSGDAAGRQEAACRPERGFGMRPPRMAFGGDEAPACADRWREGRSSGP